MNMQYVKQLIVIAAMAVGLSACGGGGGSGGSGGVAGTPSSGSTPPPSTAPQPQPVTLSANPSARVLQEGLYSYWGFGFIVNGVKQTFISKLTLKDDHQVHREIVATFATNLSTAPSILDGVIGSLLQYVDAGGKEVFPLTRIVFDEQGDFVTLEDIDQKILGWNITLTATDVAGQTVASQIKRNDGTVVDVANLGLQNPSEVFAPDSKAYLASFEATQDMMLRGSRLAFVTSEETLIGSGWCITAEGETNMLAIVIGAGGQLQFYVVPGDRCTISGLSPMEETGTWTKETIGTNVIYSLNYPESIKTGPWHSRFSGGYSARSQVMDRVIRNGTASNIFYEGYFVPKGTVIQSRQPFFNPAALPSLRHASGL